MSVLYFCLGKDKSLASKMFDSLEKEDFVEFCDGEMWMNYEGNVRGKEVVCVHLLQGEINRCLVSLLMFLESVRSEGASTITLVLPYFFYGRQDRKFGDGTCSVASRWLAKSLEDLGVDKLVASDLHAPEIVNFFSSTEVVNLSSIDIFGDHLDVDLGDVIVAPDAGGVIRAKPYAERFGVDLVFVDKRRTEEGLILNLISGQVRGKRCFVVDDILGTGGTLFGAAKLLKEHGAKNVTVVVTHAVFSGDAMSNLEKLFVEGIIDRILVSNSIPKKLCDFVEVVDISKLLVNAI